MDVLSRNVKVIAEGVARHLFELNCEVVGKCCNLIVRPRLVDDVIFPRHMNSA